MSRRATKLGVDKCKVCEEILFPSNAYITSAGGVLGTCRNCYNANREDTRTTESRRKYNYKARYKISVEEFNRLKELHLGGCAICRKPCSTGQELSVDHNHTTGKVRGLLCKNCNLALGYLKDDEDLVWNMLEYIKRYHDPRDERTFETITVQE